MSCSQTDTTTTSETIRPKVSVCMITYGHEPFIAQAIEGVLAQQANFRIELVIGEDNSPDRTKDVIGRYGSTETVEIRPVFNQINLGMQRNFLATFARCRGQYIAMLEGDDYWSDVLKLQRQVEYLDAHPEVAVCYHPVEILRDGRLQPDDLTRKVPKDIDILELARGNCMHTCSVMFRNGLIDAFPPGFERASACDYFIHMLNARRGGIHRLPQTMGVYRVHSGGVWSTAPDVEGRVLSYLEQMIGNFNPEVDRLLIQRHQDIAIRNFIERIDQPGCEERAARCQRYGGEAFAARVTPYVRRLRQLERRPLVRLLHRVLGGSQAG